MARPEEEEKQKEGEVLIASVGHDSGECGSYNAIRCSA